MKIKPIKFVAGIILLPLLASACSSNSLSEPKDSQSPSTSVSESPQPKLSPMFGLNYSGEILLAKNDLEREFLTFALNSCKKAQTDGFIITDSEGTSYFRPSLDVSAQDWPFEEVSVVDGKVGEGIYYNELPALLAPCDLEIQAQREEADAPLLEHKVRSEGNGKYTWSQHNGGYSLEPMTYLVVNDLITSYGREVSADQVKVAYGPLTDDQQTLFDQVSK